MKIGTKVRNKESGRVGVVSYSPFDLWKEGNVLVDYDGEGGLSSTKVEELEIGEILIPETEINDCANCIYFNGSACLRYKMGRMGMLLSSKNGSRIPKRIYPFCRSTVK